MSHWTCNRMCTSVHPLKRQPTPCFSVCDRITFISFFSTAAELQMVLGKLCWPWKKDSLSTSRRLTRICSSRTNPQSIWHFLLCTGHSFLCLAVSALPQMVRSFLDCWWDEIELTTSHPHKAVCDFFFNVFFWDGVRVCWRKLCPSNWQKEKQRTSVG